MVRAWRTTLIGSLIGAGDTLMHARAPIFSEGCVKNGELWRQAWDFEPLSLCGYDLRIHVGGVGGMVVMSFCCRLWA